MRMFIGAVVVLATCGTVQAQTPAPAASPCATMHTQVMNEAQRRLDAAAYSARLLAAEGQKLCVDNKVPDATAKYEAAAKGMGITLSK